MKSSHVENLGIAKFNHFVNFVNLERPLFSSPSDLMIFFLCAAHHIPQRLKPRVISPPAAALSWERSCC